MSTIFKEKSDIDIDIEESSVKSNPVEIGKEDCYSEAVADSNKDFDEDLLLDVSHKFIKSF